MTDYKLHCEGGNYSHRYHLPKEEARSIVEHYDNTHGLGLSQTERVTLIANVLWVTEDDVRDALTMQLTNQLN
jgi:hypothetical protein